MGFGFAVRLAAPKDAGHILALLFSSKAPSVELENAKLTISNLLNTTSQSESSKSLHLVVDYNEKIVGVFSLFVGRNINGTGSIFVEDLGINPHANKQRIIETILKNANKKALAAKCQKLILVADNVNESLVKEICIEVGHAQHESCGFWIKPKRVTTKSEITPLQQLVRGMGGSKL